MGTPRSCQKSDGGVTVVGDLGRPQINGIQVMVVRISNRRAESEMVLFFVLIDGDLI